MTCSECGCVEIENHSPFTRYCVACGVKHCREIDALWVFDLKPILKEVLNLVFSESGYLSEEFAQYCFSTLGEK